jgi:hypothetical protein
MERNTRIAFTENLFDLLRLLHLLFLRISASENDARTCINECSRRKQLFSLLIDLGFPRIGVLRMR